MVTPLVVFYLLVDWHPMLAKIDGWLPRDHAPTVRKLAGDINAAVAAFIRGQGTICLILGVFYALALSWACATACSSAWRPALLRSCRSSAGRSGLITALALALVQFWPDDDAGAEGAGVFAPGMALDTAVLSPQIVGEKIGLHPVWLIFALFVFSYLFGFVGMLVAVPLAAAIGVLVRFALELYLESSSVYHGHDAAGAGRAPHDRPPQPTRARSRRTGRRSAPRTSWSARSNARSRRARRSLAGLAAGAARSWSVGPGAGKSHLAHVWRLKSGAGTSEAASCDEARMPSPSPTARWSSRTSTRHRRRARAVPSAEPRPRAAPVDAADLAAAGRAIWTIALPDLRSRLRALPFVDDRPADEALLHGGAGEAVRRPAAGGRAARDRPSACATWSARWPSRPGRGTDRRAAMRRTQGDAR